jgi:hypothetical protein
MPRRGQADRNWVSSVVAICTRAGQISVLALRQSRLESPQVDDVGGLPQHIDAWQVAVFIARRLESVDT